MCDAKKDWAIAQLRQMQAQLQRLPQKDDFDDGTRSRIKAFLGPWPRALEAAGLKEAKPVIARAKRKKQAKAARKADEKQTRSGE